MRTTHAMNPLESTGTKLPSRSSAPPVEDEPIFDLRPLVTRVFGRSERGSERPTDRFLIASPVSALWEDPVRRGRDMPFSDIEGELFVVADGMGGPASGHEPRSLAVEAMETSLLSTLGWLFALGDLQGTTASVLEQMSSALGPPGARPGEPGARAPAPGDLCTTLTMAYRFGAWLFVAHAGDSRCYVLRDDKLHRVTRDHAVASDRLRRGLMGTEEAEHHELRHVVTNVIGGSPHGPRSEDHRLRLLPHDALLLCTDGLTDVVSEQQIQEVMELEKDPRAACDTLVALAHDRGAVDDVTAIVARFEKAGPERSN